MQLAAGARGADSAPAASRPAWVGEACGPPSALRCNDLESRTDVQVMVRMRRSPSPAQLAAATNPIVAAATLMVDIRLDGSVSAVLGKMDLTTRRYVFQRVDPRPDQPYGPGQLPLAVYHAAQEYWTDYVEAPFRA